MLYLLFLLQPLLLSVLLPPQFLAEGSDKVTINGQPAVRSGDRSTCDAKVVSSGLISSNVTIGGGSVVVR